MTLFSLQKQKEVVDPHHKRRSFPRPHIYVHHFVQHFNSISKCENNAKFAMHFWQMFRVWINSPPFSLIPLILDGKTVRVSLNSGVGKEH